MINRFVRTLICIVLVIASFATIRAAEEDRSLYPRSQGELKAVLQMLSPKRNGGSSLQTDYIQRLKQYRFIVGVPYEHLQWDATQADLCQHAVKILAMIGKLTHNPDKQPGMSDEEYALCKKGCGQSNLFQGVTKPQACVDGWMDDSGKGQVGALGHRRWCINPPMGKSAFAAGGNFAAMYAFDGSNKKVPDWDYVAYPARGYMPVELFGARYGWSVSPNMSKYAKPEKDSVKVEVHVADAKLAATGDPLKLDTSFVDEGGYGSGTCIIFRPESFQLKPDAVYVVDITGLKTKTRKDAPLHYVVHFVSLSHIPDGPDVAAAYTKMFQQRLTDAAAISDKLDQLETLTDMNDDENLRLADASIRSAIANALDSMLKAPALKHEQEAYVKYRILTDMEKSAAKEKDTRNARLQLAGAYRSFADAYKGTRWGEKAAGEYEKLKKEFGAN